jgi:hypothetical protein
MIATASDRRAGAGQSQVLMNNGGQEKRSDRRASADLANDRSRCSSRKTPDELSEWERLVALRSECDVPHWFGGCDCDDAMPHWCGGVWHWQDAA